MTVTASLDKSNTTDSAPPSVLPRLIGFAILIAVDAFVVWFLSRLIPLGFLPLAAAITVIAIFVNIVMLWKGAYPLRWMVVGLVLMALFTIYPILFTIWVSFTNYGEGHLITKQQAVDQILNATYLPETGKSYTWTAFKSPDGNYALWLIDTDGNGYLAIQGEPLSQPQTGEMGVGTLDEDGIPETIEGYQRLNPFQAATDQNLTNIQFGEEGRTIQIRSPREA